MSPPFCRLRNEIALYAAGAVQERPRIDQGPRLCRAKNPKRLTQLAGEPLENSLGQVGSAGQGGAEVSPMPINSLNSLCG
jgi:hypothetical protein